MQRLTRVTLLTAGAVIVAVAGIGTNYLADARQERRSLGASLTGGGDPERATAAMTLHGCPACHVIPGLRGPNGRVGPPLTGVDERVYLAGVLTNTPDNMIRWLLDPPAVDPLTAMPVTGLTETEARDIAAYLYSQ